jgi:hypothetical protein
MIHRANANALRVQASTLCRRTNSKITAEKGNSQLNFRPLNTLTQDDYNAQIGVYLHFDSQAG